MNWKFSSETELKLFLQFKVYKYLTSDSFTNPDREYIFLDGSEIKFHRLDGALEIFDFKRHLDYIFRIPERLY